MARGGTCSAVFLLWTRDWKEKEHPFEAALLVGQQDSCMVNCWKLRWHCVLNYTRGVQSQSNPYCSPILCHLQFAGAFHDNCCYSRRLIGLASLWRAWLWTASQGGGRTLSDLIALQMDFIAKRVTLKPLMQYYRSVIWEGVEEAAQHRGLWVRCRCHGRLWCWRIIMSMWPRKDKNQSWKTKSENCQNVTALSLFQFCRKCFNSAEPFAPPEAAYGGTRWFCMVMVKNVIVCSVEKEASLSNKFASRQRPHNDTERKGVPPCSRRCPLSCMCRSEVNVCSEILTNKEDITLKSHSGLFQPCEKLRCWSVQELVNMRLGLFVHCLCLLQKAFLVWGWSRELTFQEGGNTWSTRSSFSHTKWHIRAAFGVRMRGNSVPRSQGTLCGQRTLSSLRIQSHLCNPAEQRRPFENWSHFKAIRHRAFPAPWMRMSSSSLTNCPAPSVSLPSSWRTLGD